MEPLDDDRRSARTCEEFYEAVTNKNGDNDANLRHRDATSTSSQAPVDKLSSSSPETQSLPLPAPVQVGFGTVTEWIDGATIQTTSENVDGKDSQASTGFAWSLYHHTLELFSQLFPLIFAGSGAGVNRHREKSFKRSLGMLFLWGDGFRGGKLESVLEESDGLRETVIESLAAIGKILLYSKLSIHPELSTS
jgi:hypothetical protein